MDLCGYNLGGETGVVVDTVHELNGNLLSLCNFYEQWNADILLPQVGAKGIFGRNPISYGPHMAPYGRQPPPYGELA